MPALGHSTVGVEPGAARLIKTCARLAVAVLFCSLCLSIEAASFSGNGNNGFGGPIGLGSLTLTDNGITFSGTINKGSNGLNDVLVLYIDSVPGGFTNTADFADGSNGLTRAISGFDGGFNRSDLTFLSGFQPDYAIAMGPASDNFGALYRLTSGGNGSLTFISSVNLNPVGTASSGTYTFSFSAEQIGWPLNDGKTFWMLGTYISNTGYRSDEAVAGNLAGAQGWNPFVHSALTYYTAVPVLHYGSLSLLIVRTEAPGEVVRIPDQNYFESNSIATLIAYPASGWLFDHWSSLGFASGSNQSNPLFYLVTNVAHINAHFTPTASACVLSYGWLASWWPGGGNASDISGNNNGVLSNGVAFAPGIVGQAFSFDGTNSYVKAPTAGLPVAGQGRTMELWVRMDAVVAAEAFFAGYGGLGTNTQAYVMGASGTTLYFSQWGGAVFGPALALGTWYHVAVTSFGNSVTLYRNGSVVAADTLTINTPSDSQFYFGRIPGPLGDSRRLKGLIDEPTIYNRALSAEEIQAIYNAGSAGKCLPPLYFTSIKRSGTNVDLSWRSQKGMAYRTQLKTNLNETGWYDLSGDVTASSSGASKTDNTLSNAFQRFYRVRPLQ